MKVCELVHAGFDATCTVSGKRSEKTFSVSRYIGQHDRMEIFAVKWDVVSEISKVLPNDIFAELDGNSGIKNIITDRLAKSFKSWWIAST